ncbi:hypothetical protein ABVT39_024640, partial [Epinephelus coioides]
MEGPADNPNKRKKTDSATDTQDLLSSEFSVLESIQQEARSARYASPGDKRPEEERTKTKKLDDDDDAHRSLSEPRGSETSTENLTLGFNFLMTINGWMARPIGFLAVL